MGIRESLRRWLGVEQLAEAAVDLDSVIVDPRDAYRHDNGEWWLPIGTGKGRDEQEKSGFETEAELAEARRICRYIARRSAYAINGHQNRISYTIGTGHKYTVVARKGMNASPELLAAVQKLLDDFCFDNRWSFRQQEALLRRDRDGEAFLRLFPTADGRITVRFVEPGQIFTPTDQASNPNARMGILTEEDDAETPVAYFVDGEEVPASEIQHRKGCVDSNVRRGSPLFWSVVDTLKQVKQVNRNMAAGSSIQTSVAYVKSLTGTSSPAASAMRTAQADLTHTNPLTGKTSYYQEHKPGRILTKSDNITYDFPFAKTNYSAFVQVIQSNLREVASLLVMPEFMLTSDASNGSYSSTLVAEGPAVKMFERLQAEQEWYDLEIIWRVIETAIETGRLSSEVLDLIEVQVGKPTVQSRNELEEAQTAETLHRNGVLSKQTWSDQAGLDFEQEQQNIKDGGGPPPVVPPAVLPGQLPTAESAYDRLKKAAGILWESYP